MKIVIAALAVMPLLAHAVSAADFARLPKGTHLEDLRSKTSGLSAAIADGKLDKAGESLNRLFAGAGSKANGVESPSVAAVNWNSAGSGNRGFMNRFPGARAAARVPAVERTMGGNSSGARMVLVGDTDANPRSNDGAVVGAIGGAAGGAAAGASGGAVGAAAGAVGGAIAGGIAGAYSDYKEKEAKDDDSYRRGTEAAERDRRERKK